MYMGLIMLGRLKYTAELLVPELGSCENDMVTEKFKQYKSPRTDQIPTEIIPAGRRRACFEIHELINFT
jgi:hypothetical protein